MHISRISIHDFNTVGQTPNVLEVVKNGKQATSKDLLPATLKEAILNVPYTYSTGTLVRKQKKFEYQK